MQHFLASSLARARVLGTGRASLNSSVQWKPLRQFAWKPYSTSSKPEAPPKNSGKPLGNAPLYLSTVGLVGIGYYVYLMNSEKPKASVATVSALDKDKFIEFPLLRKEPYNHNTTKFTFQLPGNTGTLLPVAGLVLVKTVDDAGPKDNKGNPIVRPYTPISTPETPGEMTFLIKKYDTGKLTPYLFNLNIGDKLAFKGPLAKIPYKPNEFDQIAMIAGGSGITPMYQVLNHALSKKGDKTKFTLIFANVSPADILLREDFEKLQKNHPDRFNAVFVVDKSTDGWTGHTGHISRQIIKDHVKGPSENVKIYICGPPGQVKAIGGEKQGMNQGALGGILKELGYTEQQVFKF